MVDLPASVEIEKRKDAQKKASTDQTLVDNPRWHLSRCHSGEVSLSSQDSLKDSQITTFFSSFSAKQPPGNQGQLETLAFVINPTLAFYVASEPFFRQAFSPTVTRKDLPTLMLEMATLKKDIWNQVKGCPVGLSSPGPVQALYAGEASHETVNRVLQGCSSGSSSVSVAPR